MRNNELKDLTTTIILLTLVASIGIFSSEDAKGEKNADYSSYSCEQLQERYGILYKEIELVVRSIAPSTTGEQVADFLLARASTAIWAVQLIQHKTLAELPEINERLFELKKIAATPKAKTCAGLIDNIEELREVLGDELERKKRKTNETQLIR